MKVRHVIAVLQTLSPDEEIRVCGPDSGRHHAVYCSEAVLFRDSNRVIVLSGYYRTVGKQECGRKSVRRDSGVQNDVEEWRKCV